MPERESVAQKNAAKIAELFGTTETIAYELPLKDGRKLPLELYAPTAREVMEVIQSYGFEGVLLAQAAIDLVIGDCDIPAGQVEKAEYVKLKMKCFELCSFIDDGADAAKVAEETDQKGDGKTNLPLSHS